MSPLRPAAAGLVAVVLAGALGACARVGDQVAASPSSSAPAVSTPVSAPRRTLAVGVRLLALRRGRDRPLPTTVWYPSIGEPGGDTIDDADVAPGRFPIVLFSHGLGGLPEHQWPLLTRWAAAGFVVVAPAYPHTQTHARWIDRGDVRHQPADAAHVLAEVARLDTLPGDAFAGRLDTARICVAGFSAGGYTTSGMFTAGRDAKLRCGIVIAGAGLDSVGGDSRFRGPPASILFVHGDEDPTVSYARGRATYDRVPWPKAFLTLRGQRHGEFLNPEAIGFTQVLATTTDFLRWTLYDDGSARRRLPSGATLPGVASFSNGLDP